MRLKNNKGCVSVLVLLVIIFVGILFFIGGFVKSCNHGFGYRAGNRKPDINYRLNTNVSGYYIKKYMVSLDTLYFNHGPQNAEADIYFKNFIPVTDSALGFKYLLEFDDSDSITYVHHGGLNLASVYDFNEKQWVTNPDSLPPNFFEDFSSFFKANVLEKVIEEYKHKIPDEILFENKPDSVLLSRLD